MKMKKFITALTTAVSVLSLSVMGISAYADDVNIPYTESSKALTTSDDTNEIRLNICNTWSGNNIEDVATKTSVSEKIVVNFTVDGIGSDSTRNNPDGTTEDLCAYLIGSVGMNSAWNAGENGNEVVKIYGDGDYTATWNLDEASETIDSLILQSNIKLDEGKTLASSGITLKINYISTVGNASTSTTNTTDTATTSATTTTSATDSAVTTTSDSAVSSVAAPASAPIANAPAPTGDAGVGTAVAVMALAGVSVVVIKKKNN
ncbi:MAG: NPXTG-anchored protein [Prevotella sp.]|nr:NPXTG-anchored protein [Alistipes senegalensis]MCM1356968.1 NPXTG-anchored protein [Prevotella sp.]MCM1472451.1 NPXTG-anchored protein [Muribaculaceae bacterium]